MNQSEQINELAAALSKMQGQVGAVYKNKTAKVQMKNGGTYTYTYADLAGIWETIRPTLMTNGLAVTQTFIGATIETILMHQSGQWIKSILPLSFEGLKPQELGSLITYMRRYAITSILGISADEDDDGESVQQTATKFKEATKSTETKKSTIPAIDKSQAKELTSLASACDPNFLTNILLYMRNNFNSDKFEMLPVSHYEKIRNGLVKNVEEFARKPAA